MKNLFCISSEKNFQLVVTPLLFRVSTKKIMINFANLYKNKLKSPFDMRLMNLINLEIRL